MSSLQKPKSFYQTETYDNERILQKQMITNVYYLNNQQPINKWNFQLELIGNKHVSL